MNYAGVDLVIILCFTDAKKPNSFLKTQEMHQYHANG